jgi:hypothetical protein
LKTLFLKKKQQATGSRSRRLLHLPDEDAQIESHVS